MAITHCSPHKAPIEFEHPPNVLVSRRRILIEKLSTGLSLLRAASQEGPHTGTLVAQLYFWPHGPPQSRPVELNTAQSRNADYKPPSIASFWVAPEHTMWLLK